MERVDAHEHYVVVLVDELDHLLRAPVDVGLDQAAEAPDTMVDMHYVVARLYGVELAQAHGELAASRHVAAKVVFMEAVEDLVVGEEAYPALVVGEALVDGVGHGGERYAVAAVVEDVLEPLCLRGDIGKDEYLIPVVPEFLERL